MTDIREQATLDDKVLAYLSEELVRSSISEAMLKHEYAKLLRDTEDLELTILKQYLETNLPDPDRVSTRNGIYGEIVATLCLREFEGFWFPIRKLRFREKRNWSMRLTDLCLFRRGDNQKRPVVCYGEVKTKAGQRSLDLAVEGHNSLIRDDALENQEVLKFICERLFDLGLYDEAAFISDIRLEMVQYDKQYTLFIVHENKRWTDEILQRLHNRGLDARLSNLTINVLYLDDLQTKIDALYRNAWVGGEAIVNE